MTNPRYRALLAAALAAIFVTAAVAQATSDDPSRMPADKAMPQAAQAQPSGQPTNKMKGQPDTQAAASDQAGNKTAATKPSKPARQASKSGSQSIAALDPNERAFGQALRQCAKQRGQSRRDSCVDTAIEQFQRG